MANLAIMMLVGTGHFPLTVQKMSCEHNFVAPYGCYELNSLFLHTCKVKINISFFFSFAVVVCKEVSYILSVGNIHQKHIHRYLYNFDHYAFLILHRNKILLLL